jgi:hypothetical protein
MRIRRLAITSKKSLIKGFLSDFFESNEVIIVISPNLILMIDAGLSALGSGWAKLHIFISNAIL